MTGFIFTAGPRWLGVAPPNRLRYLLTPGLMAAGVAGWLAGSLMLAGLVRTEHRSNESASV